MDVSASMSLDSACPQSNTELSKHEHKFVERGVNSKKYGHDNIIFTNTIIYHKHQLLLIEPLTIK